MAVLIAGCGEKSPPIPPAETQIQGIVNKANGNWDALSPSDKQTLIDKLGHGNETTAKVSFSARSSSHGPPIPGAR